LLLNYINFDCLTGLRPAEAVASVYLSSDKEKLQVYYKPERMGLEHFRFPEMFFRETKKPYVSFVLPETLEIAKHIDAKLIYSQIRIAAGRKGMKLDIRFCSKIHASHRMIRY
jgi:hypothetical protein